MELVIYGVRQFGIKEYPTHLGLHGIFATTEDRDEELKTIWESMVFLYFLKEESYI